VEFWGIYTFSSHFGKFYQLVLLVELYIALWRNLGNYDDMKKIYTLIVALLFVGCTQHAPPPNLTGLPLPSHTINMKMYWNSAAKFTYNRLQEVSARDERAIKSIECWFGTSDEQTIQTVEKNLQAMHDAFQAGDVTFRFYITEELPERLQRRFEGRTITAFHIRNTRDIWINRDYPAFQDAHIKILHEMSHLAAHTHDHGYLRFRKYMIGKDEVELTNEQLLENADTYAHFIRYR
jgi:hypothetical protein